MRVRGVLKRSLRVQVSLAGATMLIVVSGILIAFAVFRSFRSNRQVSNLSAQLNATRLSRSIGSHFNDVLSTLRTLSYIVAGEMGSDSARAGALKALGAPLMRAGGAMRISPGGRNFPLRVALPRRRTLAMRVCRSIGRFPRKNLIFRGRTTMWGRKSFLILYRSRSSCGARMVRRYGR